MEKFCSQCRAVLAAGIEADWCPACGGALIERAILTDHTLPTVPSREVVDHRGIVLPRRHAAGGIITPQ